MNHSQIEKRINPLHNLLFVLLLFLYLTVCTRHLTVIPPVYEDEPWQAAVGWKLASTGIFGTDLFAGFYCAEQHYFLSMPALPIVLAAVYRVAGVGLFQTRALLVIVGLTAMGLTYFLALRLFKDTRIALLAVLLMQTLPLTGLTRIQPTGILWLDMARIARYDMMVPVFGMAALLAYISARERNSNLWFFVAGSLVAVSTLSHVYGLFWLPVFILQALWDRRSWKNIGVLILGVALLLSPYLVYILGNVHSWKGQMHHYSNQFVNRFDLLNIRFYLTNIHEEYHRYGAGLGSFRSAALRIGVWSTLIFLPLSFCALAFRALRRGDQMARAIVVPVAVFPFLFGLLIAIKIVNYTVSFMPLAMIVIAWGGVTFWDRSTIGNNARWLRTALAILLVAIVLEGSSRVAALETAARTTTPYYTYINKVRSYIPSGAHVLGLHNYWIGLEGIDYRSFLVPFLWMDSRNEPRPLSFEEGLEKIKPDIVLIDTRMRNYFANDGRQYAKLFDRWLVRHNGQVLHRIDDPTYGLMEILYLKYDASPIISPKHSR